MLTITYDALNVYIGPGSTPADRTKTCAVDLAISSPDGAQFTIAEHTYHGYAALDEGLTKIMRFTYAFRTGAEPGSTAAVDSQVTIEGGGARARGEVFTTTQPVPEASWLWSPCGSSSTLATRERVTLQSRSAGASSGGDYANVPLVHQLRLRYVVAVLFLLRLSRLVLECAELT